MPSVTTGSARDGEPDRFGQAGQLQRQSDFRASATTPTPR